MKKNRSNKARKIAYLFKIKVNSTSEGEVLSFLSKNLASFDKIDFPGKKFLITTPNPEQILLAMKDNTFSKIINSSTLSLPDGIGLIQAIKFLNLPAPKNILLKPFAIFAQGLKVACATFTDREWLEKDLKLIHGRSMMVEIIKLANKKSWRVAFLGGKGNVAQKCVDNLNRIYQKTKFIGLTGPNITNEAKPESKEDEILETEVIKMINDFKPHILFIGFGAPKQEKWAYKWLSKLNVGGIMVVGGAIDYLAGKVKLPPKWMSKYELEWLWRLFTQKKRLKRVLAAFLTFPLKVFFYKLRN
jgi:N-acetylglucosaminyldiphosphoundecaprenol N-acetyl-beta-D-mannosaminyltransferase